MNLHKMLNSNHNWHPISIKKNCGWVVWMKKKEAAWTICAVTAFIYIRAFIVIIIILLIWITHNRNEWMLFLDSMLNEHTTSNLVQSILIYDHLIVNYYYWSARFTILRKIYDFIAFNLLCMVSVQTKIVICMWFLLMLIWINRI